MEENQLPLNLSFFKDIAENIDYFDYIIFNVIINLFDNPFINTFK